MPVCTGLRGRGQVTGRSDGFSARPAARAGRRGWLFGSPGCGWCGGRKGARGCRWTELEEGAPGARCGGEGGLAAGEACGQGSCAPQPEPPWPWPPQRVGLPQDGGSRPCPWRCSVPRNARRGVPAQAEHWMWGAPKLGSPRVCGAPTGSRPTAVRGFRRRRRAGAGAAALSPLFPAGPRGGRRRRAARPRSPGDGGGRAGGDAARRGRR